MSDVFYSFIFNKHDDSKNLTNAIQNQAHLFYAGETKSKYGLKIPFGKNFPQLSHSILMIEHIIFRTPFLLNIINLTLSFLCHTQKKNVHSPKAASANFSRVITRDRLSLALTQKPWAPYGEVHELIVIWYSCAERQRTCKVIDKICYTLIYQNS